MNEGRILAAMTTEARSAWALPWGVGRPRRDSTTAAFWEPLLVAVIALVWLTTLVIDFRVALTLLMVIGFGAAAIGLRYPRLGLLGIGMLCTLNEMAGPLLLTGGLWRWNTVNYWLLVVALLFLPHLLRWGQPQSRVLLVFILLLGSEILLSTDPGNGVQQVLGVVSMFGLVIYFGRAALDLNAWYWLGVVSGVSAAGGCAAFLLQQGRLPWVNPNAWSYVPITAMLAICLAFVIHEGAPRRQFGLALLAMINSVWVFLSGSRGSLLVTAVCVAFFLTLTRLSRSVLLAMVAALVSIVILSQFTPLQDRAATRLHLLIDPSRSLSERTSGRFDLALGGWYIFEDHPFGVGTGGFSANWADLGPREGLSPHFQVQHQHHAAHAAWAKVLVENGFPGILLLAAYVCSFTVSGWRTRDARLLRLGLLVSAVLAVSWVSSEFQNKAVWLLAAGASVLLERNSIGGLSRRANSIARG